MLARGLHVAERPQQAAATVSGGAAEKIVRDGAKWKLGATLRRAAAYRIFWDRCLRSTTKWMSSRLGMPNLSSPYGKGSVSPVSVIRSANTRR